MNNNIKSLKKLYAESKSARVGQTVVCPSCQQPFVKVSYQQAFCKNRPGTICKDNYWNNVTPDKRCNRTRISPASQAFLDSLHSNDCDFYDWDEDMSWDAHKTYSIA